VSRLEVKPGYQSLATVLDDALSQAQAGKGSDRHAAHGEAFEDQQIVQIGEWMESTAFCIGQGVKKAIESPRLPGVRAEAELLGAINYLAGAVIQLRRRAERAKTEPARADVTMVGAGGGGGNDAAVCESTDEIARAIRDTIRDKRPRRSSQVLYEAGVVNSRLGEDIIADMVKDGDVAIGPDSKLHWAYKPSPGQKAEAAAFNHWQETLKSKTFVGTADPATKVGKSAPSLGPSNDDPYQVKTEIRAAEIAVLDLDDWPDEITEDEHDGVTAHRAGWQPLREELAGWLAREIKVHK
jgi:hypothetical protein